MLSRGENRSCLPRLATFVGSLFGKIEMEKHKYIPTAVPMLAGVMYTLVVARLGYRLTPLTRL